MQIRLNRFKDGKPKAMTMSYDDGVRQDIRLVKIFNKYGIKGTFHLNSGNLTDSYDPNSRCLSKAEVANVYKGHEVSMHTSTHPDPLAVSQQCWVNEILKDKRALEQLCGSIVRGISYPFGTVTRQAAETARMLGAEYARTVQSSGSFRIPEDFMYWNPTAHHNGEILQKGQDFLKIQQDWQPWLLYIWGHAYEFDYADGSGWTMIEDFCRLMGGKPEIWYATNIEIADYVNALRNLRFSADESMVFNPSALDIWISVDSQAVCIPAGQTVHLG